MSKYSLLGVCQPQRGGLSYFWGLSLRLARAATRDGHSDWNCRRRWPRCLFFGLDHKTRWEGERLIFIFFPLSPHSDISLSSHARSSSCRPWATSVELLDRLYQCETSRITWSRMEQEGQEIDHRREGWREGERNLPVLATWIHVLVSRSAEKRELRSAINMRMTRVVWFCAIPNAHGCANKCIPVSDDGWCIDGWWILNGKLRTDKNDGFNSVGAESKRRIRNQLSTNILFIKK